MMDFDIGAENRLLVETVKRFVETEVEPLEADFDRLDGLADKVIVPIREKARALGLFAMGMPAEIGGGGLDTVQLCLVEEQIGRVSNALSRRIFGQVYPMLLACKAEQRTRYLMPTMRGEKRCAMAITEPGAGSDAASISTTAKQVDGGYLINGRKHFISDGDKADYTIVMALTNQNKRARGGITLFLIDRDTPGFSVGRVQEMMGHRGCGHAELVFDDCFVPEEAVLGDEGNGFPLIMQSVSRIRLASIGARSVGLARKVLEMSRGHANERTQFGQSIGQFQMIQAMLADMATEIFAARTMVLNTAWAEDQGQDVRARVSMVKLYCSEMMGRVADRGLQIFGGMGFTRDLPIERIYRDCRVLRIYDGTSEIHRSIIAKSVLKNGLSF